MRHFILTAALVLQTTVAFAQTNTGNMVTNGPEQSPAGPIVIQTRAGGKKPTALLKLEAQQDERCRGGSGDDPRTHAACAARDKTVAKLHAVGWCYGKRGQFGYQMTWHECGPNSLRQ